MFEIFFILSNTLFRFLRYLNFWIFSFSCSAFYFEFSKNRLILLWNNLHKLPTVIFGVQKSLWIKVSKINCWWISKQIQFLNIFCNLYISSSKSLVFHNNSFVGQSFWKNNSSSFSITERYNYLTFLTAVSGFIPECALHVLWSRNASLNFFSVPYFKNFKFTWCLRKFHLQIRGSSMPFFIQNIYMPSFLNFTHS